jgi:hypothetical protein
MIIFPRRRDAFAVKQRTGGCGVCQQDIDPAAKYSSVNRAALALTACDPNPSWSLAQGIGVDADHSFVKIAGYQVTRSVEEPLAHIANRAGCMQSVLISEVCSIAAGAQERRRWQAANARKDCSEARPLLGD